MDAQAILQPVIILALLTCIMALCLYFSRIPAMKRLKIHPQQAQDTSELKKLLPDEVNRISNNYNHLFEQPTLFYAIALTLAQLGLVDQFHVFCAWGYVIIRCCHSLVQATIDKVMWRFMLFILSWLVLGIMVIRTALTIF